MEGNKSFVSCLGILAKNIVMAIVLYIAGIVTFAKRDILRNENKWLNIILIICMIIMQRVVIQMSGYEVYQLPFASTLFIFDNPTSNLVQILYAYIPLPFVLFYFSGNAREITTGYGKLWLIRSYSRERLYLKMLYYQQRN